MNSGFAKLGTHNIFYKIQGNGPRLMMITGTNSDTRTSPTIYDAPGAQNFEILNFDHRGMGQSTSPNEPPTLQSYADDIAKLLDIIGWEETAVVGVSFGGMVAQHFALSYAEKITRLALCCTSSGGAGGSSYPLHTLSNLTAEEYASFIMKKMNLKHDENWQKEHPKLATRTYEYYYQGAAPNYNDPVKFAAMKQQFKARADHDVYDRLKTLELPTFVAGGELDGVAPPENSSAIAAVIPNCELEIFRGGHLFLKEDAKAWPRLFSFLNPNS